MINYLLITMSLCLHSPSTFSTLTYLYLRFLFHSVCNDTLATLRLVFNFSKFSFNCAVLLFILINFLVGMRGIEPPISKLSALCLNQLGHIPIYNANIQ